jgi:hypothetical protein
MEVSKAEILQEYSYFSITLKQGDKLPVIEQQTEVTIVWYGDKKVVIPNKHVKIITDNITLKYNEHQLVTDGTEIFEVKSSTLKDNKIAYMFYNTNATKYEHELKPYHNESENIFISEFLKLKLTDLNINKCKDFLIWLNTEEGNNYLKQCKYDNMS